MRGGGKGDGRLFSNFSTSPIIKNGYVTPDWGVRCSFIVFFQEFATLVSTLCRAGFLGEGPIIRSYHSRTGGNVFSSFQR